MSLMELIQDVGLEALSRLIDNLSVSVSVLTRHRRSSSSSSSKATCRTVQHFTTNKTGSRNACSVVEGQIDGLWTFSMFGSLSCGLKPGRRKAKHKHTQTYRQDGDEDAEVGKGEQAEGRDEGQHRKTGIWRRREVCLHPAGGDEELLQIHSVLSAAAQSVKSSEHPARIQFVLLGLTGTCGSQLSDWTVNKVLALSDYDDGHLDGCAL
ncbi:hypothetical protein D9C73_000476 [Collichthys lucidus]|uniref:Uncharacterized protein n=1 Tax=Collichthys lucidus TaxID=240159 RepID=A0A4U5TY43_COLLU|nr:hypothetical protein D9C73_000476 [Collichthys lucidus]